MNFADQLIEAINRKRSPVCVGLDPRLELIPDFIKNPFVNEFGKTPEAAAHAILEFNKGIIDAIHNLVPIIKPQSAFYEQYGHHGWWALEETIQYAHEKELLVLLDAKRNDIRSTAEAYSAATIGEVDLFGVAHPALNVDAATITPYLGSDGIMPFIEDCKKYDKGIFILVKTSNPSSSEIQNLLVGAGSRPGRGSSISSGLAPVHERADTRPAPTKYPFTLYEHLANLVNDWGQSLIGSSGYSSVGAVIGATYPEEAAALRKIMPHSIFLVPGYGTQGATAEDIKPCFNDDGLGAIINNSRGIIYAYEKFEKPSAYAESAREAVIKMNKDIVHTLGS